MVGRVRPDGGSTRQRWRVSQLPASLHHHASPKAPPSPIQRTTGPDSTDHGTRFDGPRDPIQRVAPTALSSPCGPVRNTCRSVIGRPYSTVRATPGHLTLNHCVMVPWQPVPHRKVLAGSPSEATSRCASSLVLVYDVSTPYSGWCRLIRKSGRTVFRN